MVATQPTQRTRQLRRCTSVRKALAACVRSNPLDPQVCDGLSEQLITCLGEILAPQRAEEHARCYFAVGNGVAYQGRQDCQREAKRLRAAVQNFDIAAGGF